MTVFIIVVAVLFGSLCLASYYVYFVRYGKKGLEKSNGISLDEVRSLESKTEKEPETVAAGSDGRPKNAELRGENEKKSPNSDIINSGNNWKCSCEGGLFLPNNLLKSFGAAEAVFRMGSGECYHKQL